MTDEIEQRLDALGRTPATPADQQFADRLESHLRAVGAQRQRAGATSRPWWQPVVVAAALVVAIGVGVLAADRWLGSDTDELVVVAAIDTEVVLADGSVVAAVPGLVVPDGARILVGDEGGATVGDVVLAPGAEVDVAGGALVVEADDTVPSDGPDPDRTTSPPSTAAPSSTPPESSAPSTTSGSSPSSTDGSLSTSTTRPTTATTAERATTSSSASSSTRPPTTVQGGSTTVTDGSTSTTGGTPRPGTVVLEISAIGDGEIRLTWSTPDRDVDGWEVRRRNGDRDETVAVIRRPTTTSIVLSGRVAGRYRVLGRTADGAVVVESNTVSVG